ncbi:MAG: DUF1778 domain-containing protein [Thiohalomonadaceae bacterium]
MVANMPSTERLDIKLSQQDKALFSRAAALEGVSMAAFLRSAAKERALLAVEREQRIQLTERDFNDFSDAISKAFALNEPLKRALEETVEKVRRA